MKRALFLGIFGLMALFLSNCSTIVVEGDAQLAKPTDICQKVAEKRYVYFLYGLVPIGDNSTASIIPPGKKVRVETKYTVIDVLIGVLANSFIPTTIQTKTAEVYVCEK